MEDADRSPAVGRSRGMLETVEPFIRERGSELGIGVSGSCGACRGTPGSVRERCRLRVGVKGVWTPVLLFYIIEIKVKESVRVGWGHTLETDGP